MSIYDKFTSDIEQYLNSKLPDLPESTQMEIGEYISNRVSRLVTEAYNENEERMRKRYKWNYNKAMGKIPDGDS